MVQRFTDNFIKNLRPKAERYEKWEGGGFGIRVSPSGAKSWIWVYHFNGRPRRMTLGSYPDPPANNDTSDRAQPAAGKPRSLGLADARVKLAEARKLLERGIDPGDREVQRRKADRTAETTEELAGAYLEKWARPRKRSAAEDERILRKDVIPTWKGRKAKDIARRDVIALLDMIVDRGSPIAANRTLAVIRRMFAWALSRDIVLVNPCAAVKAPGREARRDRVLSTDEIATLWRALGSPQTPISVSTCLALKLQLATAQRKGEVVNAEWSEIDLDEEVWTIPGHKTNNGMPHRVPLSPLALAVLDEVRAATGDRQTSWLFKSPRRDGPITGPAVDHAMRNNRDVLETGDATPHDLRRTAASHMTSIGISRLVVSKLLNHAEAGVTAVYDRHSYDREKRAALDAWSARLEEIIGDHFEGPKIVRLHA